MQNLIIVFNNRNQTMQMASYLKRIGVNCKTISTPRELSVSCGTSILLGSADLQKVKYVISNFKFSALVGVFAIITTGVGKKYNRLI